MGTLVCLELKKKNIFHQYFFNKDISVVAQCSKLKFEIAIPEILTQGRLSQIFNVEPSFYFMHSRRKKSFKK